MAETTKLKEPWLIAAWAGMGNVSLIAGGYLIEKLGAKPVRDFSTDGLFDLQHVDVADGIATAGRVPRSVLYEWKDPAGNRDLLIFIGEAQPRTNGYDFCQQLLEYTLTRGVKRVITFAAMSTQLHPSTEPRVFVVATEQDALAQARDLGAEVLAEGQISGLNGVLLAVAAEHGLPGVCLMGELPFFAVGVPNPRSALVVLQAFSELAGIELDLSELARQSDEVEEGLLELLERMQEAAGQQGGDNDDEAEFTAPEFAEGGEEGSESEGDGKPPPLDRAVRHRIEALFADAERDRTRALELKAELDRHGVFERFEDRFLDLFRKAE